jgi:hypothetical protein
MFVSEVRRAEDHPVPQPDSLTRLAWTLVITTAGYIQDVEVVPRSMQQVLVTLSQESLTSEKGVFPLKIAL